MTKRECDKNRGQWSSKTEFILSCIGYAVGIGNVWRFPYLCYRNGGGAFLVPYLLMLFLCGIPLFFMEIVLGQFASIGCIGIFRMAPILKGAGFAIVVVNLICTCNYSVVISYPILFVWRTIATAVPWISCGNPWNTEKCVELADLSKGNYTDRSEFKTPADEFFHLEILKITDGIHSLGTIVWPLFVCLALTWVAVFFCIFKGIKSVGKVVYFTATFPYVILLILFVRGITLPGAMKGIVYYIQPEWVRLLDLKVWADAAIQIFFSLGPGWGGIVNMASYNNFRNNAQSDAIIIPLVNCSTSIFAGFVVFSVLGFLSHQTGIPVASVAAGGPGLAFVAYPQAIAMMPVPHLWSVMFFTMLFLLGLDSEFVQIEAIISSILDEIPRLRAHKLIVTLVACIVMFLISILMVTQGGMYILQLLDWYAASVSVILVCLIEVLMVAWLYGVDNFLDDIQFMLGLRPSVVWKLCWKFITPAILGMIFLTTIVFNRNITYNSIEYPSWAICVGWMSCVASILWIPMYFVYVVLKADRPLPAHLLHYMKHDNWEPANEHNRLGYEEFKLSLANGNVPLAKKCST